ncbi:MAG TPA: ABC transporter permease [Acidimicrobiia bacterium]|nr:ABC transporter permease [Acidimicrobiia bacterium]
MSRVQNGRRVGEHHLRPLDVAAVGVTGLRVRRGRAVLTALGIAIGIAAMVAVLGISASSRADLLDRLDRLGTNLLEVSPGQSVLGQSSKLPSAAPRMIRRLAPVLDAAAVADVDTTVRRTDKIPAYETNGIGVEAAEPSLLDSLAAHLRTGTFLNRATARYPAVVLGAKTAELLGIDSLDGSPQVLIGNDWFTVVGILAPVPLVPSLDRTAIVGFPVAKQLFGIDGSASTVYVRTDPDHVDAVRAVLPATANPENANEVEVTRPSDVLAARAATDDALTALLLGLGGVALLVGGIGIANVMVISVLERRTEIGVRRALGATRGHIRTQFVVEATLLAAIGGIAGVLLGAAVTGGYAASRGWTLAVPIVALAGGAAAALVIGALAGIYPATRAARLAPAEAVRPA